MKKLSKAGRAFGLFPIIFLLSLFVAQAATFTGNISDSIIQEFFIDSSVGTAGAFQDMLTISDNIVAITYTSVGNDGTVLTINISNTNGNIINIIDSHEWDTASALESKIIPIDDTYYAIVSRGATGDGFLDTVNISSEGKITQDNIDTFEFDTGDAVFPDIIKVDENVYAIAYRGVDTDGYVVTVNISNQGIITQNILDTFEFNAVNANQVDIFNITKNTYALVYEGDSPLSSVLQTINISDDGTIGETLSKLIIDTNPAADGKIMKIGNSLSTTYAVAYESILFNGTIKTFEILNNGTIVQILDSQQYDSTGTNVDVINIDENVIGLAYQGLDGDGFIKTFNIADNGIIGPEIDVLEWELFQAEEASISRLTVGLDNDIFAIAYEDEATRSVLVTFNISTLAIPDIPPATPPQAIQIKELFFPNASTTQSSFQTISTAKVNVTRLSDLDAVISFQARREGGVGADDYSWRILIDGEAKRNITRSLSPTSIGSVVFSGDRDDIAIGEHNITLQHLSTEGTLFTENIDMVINVHLTENNTRVNHGSGEIDTSFASTSYTEIDSGTVTVTENSSASAFITIMSQSTAANTAEFILEYNNDNSSSFRRRMKDSTDVGSIGYVWNFNNVEPGVITWKLWGRNTEAVTTAIDAHIDIDQLTNDNIPTTHSHFTNESSRIDVEDTYILIGNLSITTVRDNSVYASAGFTANIENQGAVPKNVSYYLEMNGATSQLMSRSLADFNDIGNLYIQHVFNDSATTHNVNLYVSAELGGIRELVISNASMFAIEVVDFESVIITPEIDVTDPEIILISPGNNTINNTYPLNITIVVTDDGSQQMTCLLRNTSQTLDEKTFNQGANFMTLGSGTTSSFYQEFPDLEIECFDNAIQNNSAIMLLNYTIDKVLPLMDIISPLANATFNKIYINSINMHTTCYDDNVYKLNVSVYNLTDIIFSEADITPVAGMLEINTAFDISLVSPGTYTKRDYCADTHTRANIPDYTIRKNTSENKIKWTTPEGNEFELKYSVPSKNPIEALSYGSYKSTDNTKYVFYYIMNVTAGEEREFTFELESKKFPIVYLPSSEYPAHFIMGNNWMDFEFGDDDAEYEVTMNDNNNYEITITTTSNNLTFSSVGELNFIEVISLLTIVYEPPREDEYVLGSCPVDTLPRAILFIFFIIMAFVIVILGFAMKNGLIASIGSLMIIGLGVYTWFCLGFISLMMMLLGVILLTVSIFKGAKAFR